MSTVRAYVPLDRRGLASLAADGGLGESLGYAATERLAATLPDADTEQLEYVAMTVAARASLVSLDPDDPADARRVVAAVDAELAGGPPSAADHPAAVRVAAVRLADVASVHVDTPDLADRVRAAVRGLPAAADGDAQARDLLDGLDAEDLAWYATQEIDDLLA